VPRPKSPGQNIGKHSRSEYDQGRNAHSTNVPLIELSAHLHDLVRENRPVVVVCKTDRRSSMAAQQLQDAGLSDVAVLRGGMERWRVLGLPAN
jgi:rhodanese-related sulfurtransferase